MNLAYCIATFRIKILLRIRGEMSAQRKPHYPMFRSSEVWFPAKNSQVDGRFWFHFFKNTFHPTNWCQQEFFYGRMKPSSLKRRLGGVLNKSRANTINLFTSNTEVFSLVKCSQLRTLTEVVHKGQIKWNSVTCTKRERGDKQNKRL